MPQSPAHREADLRLFRILLVVVLTAALSSGVADAGVTVEIGSFGVVQNDGAAVTTFVKVSCTPVGGVTRPLEALLTLSQNRQRIHGEGYMTTITCNGRARSYLVRVDAFERLFHRGSAYASAFVLVCNNSGSVCRQGQDTRDITLF